MDVDAYAYAHRRAWERLDQLARRRRLTGAESDELVALYRRTSQQVARLQVQSPEAGLLAGLSTVLARSRAQILGSRTDAWAEIARFVTHRFPAAVYRARRWWLGVAAVFLGVTAGLAIWVPGSGTARRAFGIPSDTGDMTDPGGRFETYYSEHPHDAFAAQVWTNNAWVAAGALFTGALILPAVYMLFMNALNLGVSAGLMAEAGRLDAFFGFILPHGMLELTAIFVAGGAGLQLGWTLIDPGRDSRARALARRGRAAATIALGLSGVLLVSGLIEGFVTPSGWPAPIRIGIGVLAEVGFLVYVFGPGRWAAQAEAMRRTAAASETSRATGTSATEWRIPA